MKREFTYKVSKGRLIKLATKSSYVKWRHTSSYKLEHAYRDSSFELLTRLSKTFNKFYFELLTQKLNLYFSTFQKNPLWVTNSKLKNKKVSLRLTNWKLKKKRYSFWVTNSMTKLLFYHFRVNNSR